jgi:elongation factor P
MTTAAEIRPGMALRIEGSVYRVLDSETHQGGGKMGGVVHARLENIDTGGQTDQRFRPDERVDRLDLDKRTLTYLYYEEDSIIFMDAETYEQIPVPAPLLGPLGEFLHEEMQLHVEFFEERPVRVHLPEYVEVTVESAAPPMKQGEKSTWKAATLANGIEIQVPLFIGPGDVVRIQVATRRYHDRVRSASHH